MPVDSPTILNADQSMNIILKIIVILFIVMQQNKSQNFMDKVFVGRKMFTLLKVYVNVVEN